MRCGTVIVSVGLFLFCYVNAQLVETPPLKSGGKHWAILVAGSNGWYNYRHQADVCHAYHVMKDHGIPEENIIVMMYDDIARAPQNPTPGIIINRPNGEDVYKGVKIDYKAEDVTPEIFLAALQGKKEKLRGKGTGRVIESGPNDHIFVNFVDHGAPGLVAFPTEEMHAKTFINALKEMQADKKYAQMVIYIEACESGSMFKNLLKKNEKIYATTAANGHESSYAFYYDSKRQTYLGDLYSVKWMEDSDVSDLNKETLQAQFKRIKAEVNMSHVQEFGDFSIAHEPVGDFQGNAPSARNIYYPKIEGEMVRSHDVELDVLSRKLAESTIDEERQLLQEQLDLQLKYRDSLVAQMKHILAVTLNDDHKLVADAMTTRTDDINFNCYEPAVRYYSDNCRRLSLNEYALRVLFMLQNVCNMEGMKLETIKSAMDKVC